MISGKKNQPTFTWTERYHSTQPMPGTNAVAGMVDNGLPKFTPLDTFQEEFPIQSPRLKKRLVRNIEMWRFYSEITLRSMSNLRDWSKYMVRQMDFDTRKRVYPMKVWRTPKQAATGWCVEIYYELLYPNLEQEVNWLLQEISKGTKEAFYAWR